MRHLAVVVAVRSVGKAADVVGQIEDSLNLSEVVVVAELEAGTDQAGVLWECD
jgi:hypothetical protein